MIRLLPALVVAGALSSQTLNYTYDPAGRLDRVAYPNGKTLFYAYDAAGNLLRREVLTPAAGRGSCRHRRERFERRELSRRPRRQSGLPLEEQCNALQTPVKKRGVRSKEPAPGRVPADRRRDHRFTPDANDPEGSSSISLDWSAHLVPTAMLVPTLLLTTPK